MLQTNTPFLTTLHWIGIFQAQVDTLRIVTYNILNFPCSTDTSHLAYFRRVVVWKIIYDEDAKARFIHEAQAASALDHNNICTIHEVDETEDGQLFIAMALYEGETLKDKIERKDP